MEALHPVLLRALGRALLGVLAVLATGACQLDLAVEVDVERDGAGTLAVTVGADRELLAQAEVAGVDPLAEVAEAGEALAEDGWEVAARAEGQVRSVTLRRRFADPEELARLSRQLADGLAAPEIAPLGPFTVELGEDVLTVVGHADLVPEPSVTDIGLQPQDAVRLVAEADAVDYTVRVRTPGPILDAAGEPTGEREAVVRVAPGESVDVRVVAVRPGPPLWPVAVGGVLGASAAAAVLVALGRRRRA